MWILTILKKSVTAALSLGSPSSRGRERFLSSGKSDSEPSGLVWVRTFSFLSKFK